MPTQPRKNTPKPRRKSPGVTLTPARRRELLEDRLDGIIETVETRAEFMQKLGNADAWAIDQGTLMILTMNKSDLVRTYSTAAEQSPQFARVIDTMITGGVWGELLTTTVITFTGIAIIRGWIDLDQLPPFARRMVPNLNPTPPPSQEVAEEAARQAAQAQAQPTPPPSTNGTNPGPAVPRPAAKKRAPKPRAKKDADTK